MISRRTVVCLGTAQLIAWGTSYYLIGVFGEHIAATSGWSRGFIYGGFSVGLLVMGFASAWAGGAVDRHGGLPVLASGSLLNAAGCLALAFSNRRGEVKRLSCFFLDGMMHDHRPQSARTCH